MSSIERDELIRHFGTYSLSRDYDRISEIPGPDIFGEDGVLFPWAEFTKTAREGMSAWPVPLENSGPSRSPGAVTGPHHLSMKNS